MELREIDRTSRSDISLLSTLFKEYAAEVKPDMSPTVAEELATIPCFRGFMAFDDGKPTQPTDRSTSGTCMT